MDRETASRVAADGSTVFVQKLYRRLEAPQNESVLRCGQEGDTFVILDIERFTRRTIPDNFKHNNFASFVRQLNKYGFHKVQWINDNLGSSSVCEFQHPEFKMGKRNALDRIRRQPAAPQVLNTLLDNDGQTTQIGLFSTQLATTWQQSQRILEKCNELGIRDPALLQALRNLREIIESQGHAAGCLESLLVSVYARQQYGQNINFPLSHTEGTTSDVEAQKPTNCHLTPRTRKDIPASPFRLASRVSSEAKTEYFVNSVDFEKQNQCHKPIKATSAIPYQIEMGTSSDRALLQCPAVTSLPTAQGNLDRIAYPVGQLQCIDPIYNSDVHNIIEIRSSGAPPLAHTTIDPCWTRQPLVLLVEDDETCRRIGGILLRSLQCRIDSASDGLEAVSKFHAGLRYDLVLMDIIMPNLDGVSATQFVRRIDSTPIFAMTSDVSYEHVAMCFQYGMNDVLPKPFMRGGLFKMLEKHLSHIREHR